MGVDYQESMAILDFWRLFTLIQKVLDVFLMRGQTSKKQQKSQVSFCYKFVMKTEELKLKLIQSTSHAVFTTWFSSWIS